MFIKLNKFWDIDRRTKQRRIVMKLLSWLGKDEIAYLEQYNVKCTSCFS